MMNENHDNHVQGRFAADTEATEILQPCAMAVTAALQTLNNQYLQAIDALRSEIVRLFRSTRDGLNPTDGLAPVPDPTMAVCELAALQEQNAILSQRAMNAEIELRTLNEKLAARFNEISILTREVLELQRQLAEVQAEMAPHSARVTTLDERAKSPDDELASALLSPTAHDILQDIANVLSINCHVMAAPEGVTVQAVKEDSQLRLLVPVQSGPSGLRVIVRMLTHAPHHFQIFYRSEEELEFSDHQSASFNIPPGISVVNFIIPLPDRSLFLRLDPMDVIGTMDILALKLLPV
ncbi:hypothetical protein IP70_13490 [alpha proteobacterium AAP38]|nr:hypothetical protein IP70_13490 [alpha proteobacterium AAP38]